MTAIRYSQGDFLQFQTENNAALQLIEKAKNRLYKFYRPNLYKEAPKQELTDEEKILAASGRHDRPIACVHFQQTDRFNARLNIQNPKVHIFKFQFSHFSKTL